MMPESDHTYYQRRAEKQLSIASTAVDSSIKAIHLDLASRYEILRDQAAQSGFADGLNVSTPIRVASKY